MRCLLTRFQNCGESSATHASVGSPISWRHSVTYWRTTFALSLPPIRVIGGFSLSCESNSSQVECTPQWRNSELRTDSGNKGTRIDHSRITHLASKWLLAAFKFCRIAATFLSSPLMHHSRSSRSEDITPKRSDKTANSLALRVGLLTNFWNVCLMDCALFRLRYSLRVVSGWSGHTKRFHEMGHIFFLCFPFVASINRAMNAFSFFVKLRSKSE